MVTLSRAITSKLAVLEIWRMATAGGEFYRDTQDERDGPDTVGLIRPINIRPSEQSPRRWCKRNWVASKEVSVDCRPPKAGRRSVRE